MDTSNKTKISKEDNNTPPYSIHNGLNPISGDMFHVTKNMTNELYYKIRSLHYEELVKQIRFSGSLEIIKALNGHDTLFHIY